MARSADITLDWADGTYLFRLAIGQLRELQEKAKVGPLRLLKNLIADDWMVDDAPNIIRLGLIGGGMPPAEALKKVRVYVEDRPPAENTQVALAVLMCGIYGSDQEPLGKEGAPATATETTTSNSPPSMAMAS